MEVKSAFVCVEEEKIPRHKSLKATATLRRMESLSLLWAHLAQCSVVVSFAEVNNGWDETHPDDSPQFYFFVSTYFPFSFSDKNGTNSFHSRTLNFAFQLNHRFFNSKILLGLLQHVEKSCRAKVKQLNEIPPERLKLIELFSNYLEFLIALDAN